MTSGRDKHKDEDSIDSIGRNIQEEPIYREGKEETNQRVRCRSRNPLDQIPLSVCMLGLQAKKLYLSPKPTSVEKKNKVEFFHSASMARRSHCLFFLLKDNDLRGIVFLLKCSLIQQCASHKMQNHLTYFLCSEQTTLVKVWPLFS